MPIITAIILFIYLAFGAAVLGAVIYHGVKRAREYKSDKYKNIKY